jgi:hypothetical protein
VSTVARSYWDFFAEEAANTGSPLYGRLAAAIGGDEDLKALAARARPGQPHANMILGAVHFLLLRGAAHPLARFYPSLGGKTEVADEDPFPDFRDFAAANEPLLADLIESRVTNTNEIGRSAVLHPGFRVVAAEAGTPLNLIEIGPSAGLNMFWDRYGIRYMRDGKIAAEVASASPVLIQTELQGGHLPPAGPSPSIARCIGLELNPNDLSDPDNRDWLRALVWPEHSARLKRLEAAMALALRTPPDIRAGDALVLLLDTIAGMPQNEPICVFHTIALYQFSREMKAALEDLLTVAGLRRPVWRLGFEFDPESFAAAGGPSRAYCLTLARYEGGERTSRLLARAHSHGNWLEWLA